MGKGDSQGERGNPRGSWIYIMSITGNAPKSSSCSGSWSYSIVSSIVSRSSIPFCGVCKVGRLKLARNTFVCLFVLLYLKQLDVWGFEFGTGRLLWRSKQHRGHFRLIQRGHPCSIYRILLRPMECREVLVKSFFLLFQSDYFKLTVLLFDEFTVVPTYAVSLSAVSVTTANSSLKILC